MGRSRLRPYVLVVVALTMAAGCGSGRVSTGSVELPAEPVCPPRYVSAGEPRPLEDVVVGAVVLCDDGQRTTDEYVELRYTAGIQDTVAVLSGAGGGAAEDGWCSGEELIADIEVLIVTEAGDVVVPELPRDECGSTNTAVMQLYGLKQRAPDTSLVVEAAEPAQELTDRSGEAAAAGCPRTLAHVLPALERSGADAEVPVLPGPDGPPVRGCLMEVLDTDEPTLGYLFGGGSAVLDRDRLQRGLDHVGPLRDCTTSSGLVTAWLVGDEPLFFSLTGDECATVWTPEGVVGSLDEVGVGALS
jgi:hypothetical protein